MFSGTTDYCAKAAATFKGSWTHFVQTLPESGFLAAVDDLLHSLSNQMPNKGQPERILEDIIMATGKLASKKPFTQPACGLEDILRNYPKSKY